MSPPSIHARARCDHNTQLTTRPATFIAHTHTHTHTNDVNCHTAVWWQNTDIRGATAKIGTEPDSPYRARMLPPMLAWPAQRHFQPACILGQRVATSDTTLWAELHGMRQHEYRRRAGPLRPSLRVTQHLETKFAAAMRLADFAQHCRFRKGPDCVKCHCDFQMLAESGLSALLSYLHARFH